MKQAVYDVKDTNFESNSQHKFFSTVRMTAVYDVKDTNFESNSQHYSQLNISMMCCL